MLVASLYIHLSNTNFEENKVLNPDRSNYEFPEWVKNNAYWWSEGHITDTEWSYAVEYMVEKGLVKITDCEGECFET